MYNVTTDPMELENLAGKAEWQERESDTARAARRAVHPQTARSAERARARRDRLPRRIIADRRG